MTSDCSSGGKHYIEGSWPPLRGDYVVGDPEGRVAVVTLASVMRIENSAISGTCKTENLGVEKIVANLISNSNIRFLLICGAESKGHLPGNTLIALHKNGLDEKSRIIGSKGAIPFMQNLTTEAVRRFQAQIQLIDRIGMEDEKQIRLLVEEYSSKGEPYPEEPFQAIKLKSKRGLSAPLVAGIGDVLFGSDVALDSVAWMVTGG
ncbi:Tetrahydromethanopterin S-methyltransferase subunit A 1 [uncultured archaeon]|nr:Tetrahydromethanopterin S-methyltransferase subunit A 1 [uncultured archaeon]